MQDWCRAKLETSHPTHAAEIAQALTSRAPIDLRVNTAKSTRAAVIEKLGQSDITATPSDIASTALRVVEGARRVKNSYAYLEGEVELQDAGSQALVDQLPFEGVKRILDFCAGGGGKALAMAARANTKVFAHDSDAARMKDIPIRAKRAGVSITCQTSADLADQPPFDLVLCDAPCSGSGAWRRSPDAKWRLSEEMFNGLLDVQASILKDARAFVRPGGVLAYATCSLFAEENEYQINDFLAKSPEFELIANHSWTPLDGCDGFFLSKMRLKD